MRFSLDHVWVMTACVIDQWSLDSAAHARAAPSEAHSTPVGALGEGNRAACSLHVMFYHMTILDCAPPSSITVYAQSQTATATERGAKRIRKL